MNRLARIIIVGFLIGPLLSAAPAIAAKTAPAIKPQPLTATTPGSATNIPNAQSAATGLSITPAVQDLALSPATVTARYSVQVYNNTHQTLNLQLSSRDFTTLSQTGGISFLDGNQDAVTKGHGLQSTLQLDKTLLTLKPQSSEVVTATVGKVSSLAPGGHYAAIIARTINGSGGSGNRVGINAAVASLVFLETAGQGSKNLTLLPPQVGGVSFGLPDNLNLVFKATGNTQTTPRGTVTVRHGDTILLRGQINVDSGLVLPGTTRLLNVGLNGDHHPWWPGRYQLTVAYQYDGSLGSTTVNRTLLYINPLAILILLGLALLVLVVIVLLRRHWQRFSRPVRTISVRLYRRGQRLYAAKISRQTVTAVDAPIAAAPPIADEPPAEVDEPAMMSVELDSTEKPAKNIIVAEARTDAHEDTKSAPKTIQVTVKTVTGKPSKTSDKNHKK